MDILIIETHGIKEKIITNDPFTCKLCEVTVVVVGIIYLDIQLHIPCVHFILILLFRVFTIFRFLSQNQCRRCLYFSKVTPHFTDFLLYQLTWAWAWLAIYSDRFLKDVYYYS